ncbi:11898_t:CDS:1 [Racocetra persica]|uniref:11898_t:CDS:1 n=1 Tax=Racocetra persica TaxID=160502 RepID=A0ACA9RBP3_9GLOM|nr:11898_t:CDS:1 [Racocetra persica]
METEKKYLNKIICLFYPSLLNNFGFQSEKGITFFSEKKAPNIKQFLAELVTEKQVEKLIFLNYPQQEEQLNELKTELAKIDRQITNIILFHLENYDLLEEIWSQYLICPSCEKIFVKQTFIQENGQFICPQEGKVKFSSTTVAEFNQNYWENYFKNNKILLEKILATEEKTSPLRINRLTIRQKEELFSGEIREKLWEIINNI